MTVLAFAIAFLAGVGIGFVWLVRTPPRRSVLRRRRMLLNSEISELVRREAGR